MVRSNPKIFDLVKCINLLSETNDYISYGLIKKACLTNPSSLLDEALEAKILIKNDNKYKFKNNAIFYGT